MKRLALLTLFFCLCAQGSSKIAPRRISLNEAWQIQSSAKIKGGGETLSTPSYQPRGWFGTAVPTTVLAALVDNGVYKDPNKSKNLRDIPGTTYKAGSNFSNQDMSPDSPFFVSWWYRKTFEVPALRGTEHFWLHFDGINYRANIWVNGKKAADARDVVGTFRTFEFDITRFLNPSGENTLAVEVFPPLKNDLGLTWVDWNPMPPDKNMGLWGDVYLVRAGAVHLETFHVTSDLDVPSLQSAKLRVSAQIKNALAVPVVGTFKGNVAGVDFSKPFHVEGFGSGKVTVTADDVPGFRLVNPRVWWPIHLGPQNLYKANLAIVTAGAVSDSASIDFGVRKITSEMTAQGHLLFKINGHNILIRGGGWAPDMMLRDLPAKVKTEMQYVADLGLNTVRGEGKFERGGLVDLADQMGILQMMGWSCCDHWESWKSWKGEERQVASESLRSRIRELRNHPSALMWLNGSDNAPPADVERMYLKILQEEEWDLPVVSSASGDETEVTGASGVKMTGPYQYIAPNYWLTAKTAGGAFGFNTETSPGPAIPEIESLKAMFSPDELWPPDMATWDLHGAGGWFKTNLGYFNAAVTHRFGKPATLEDYVMKSQVLAYETHRAMFEAHSRNKYDATGVIQWMLNSAWPSVTWNLFDYYLRPGGAYFGAKKANELVHIMYSYDDNSVALINHSYQDVHGLKVAAHIYDFNMREIYHREQGATIRADSTARAFMLPSLSRWARAKTYFVDLELSDDSGRTVSRNFYWLSNHPDVPGNNVANQSLYTQSLKHADLTQLQALPTVSIQARLVHDEKGKKTFELFNHSKSLAFFVRLKLAIKKDEEVLPTFWDDNDISLLPGEKRSISARYEPDQVQGRNPHLEWLGWNVRQDGLR